ncbi:Cys-every-fifth RiPP peptide CefA [Legionella moravica]|uniref:Cys-every-fifth RiPP peptide CefA n=1 Tax=Legionella moravica TaxID=39962 RepID=UPI003B75CBDA
MLVAFPAPLQTEHHLPADPHFFYFDLVCYSADLCFADLYFVDLYFVDLYFVDLYFVDLCFVDLCFADLCFADLCFVDLCFVDLCFVDLCFVDLCFVDLYFADLCYFGSYRPYLYFVFALYLSLTILLTIYGYTMHPDYQD